MSYASTGTALSDKTLYDLFARTVPSDMFQARAIADIVHKLGWSYVSLVSSEGLYGDSGSKEFVKQASRRKICIATHEKISPTIGEQAIDAVVQKLSLVNATGVVLFTRAEDTRELLLAVKRAKLVHNFAWVAADGWGTHQKLVEGVEEVAWGAITVELQAKAIPGFDEYMRALTPWGNARNPWFSEHWQEWFDCQLQANLLQQQRLASGYSRRSPLQADTEATDAGQAPPGAWLAAPSASMGADGVYRPEADQIGAAAAAAEESNLLAGDSARGRRSARERRLAGAQNCSNREQDKQRAPNCPPTVVATPPTTSSSPEPATTTTTTGHSLLRPQDELVSLGSPSEAAGRRRARRSPRPSSGGGAPDEEVKQFCSPNLKISESNGYRQEQKVQFVVDAVYAMAHALHAAHLELCAGQPGEVCEALKELNGECGEPTPLGRPINHAANHRRHQPARYF